MAGQPLISILMTAFNREKYIPEAIESVLVSTYKNFELIIVDDHSSDRTVEIARYYAEKDSRISIFINEERLGDYPNRNKAASYAKGKYIKFVDSDDYIYPWGLEIMVNMMEQFPNADWGLCTLAQSEYLNQPFPVELTPKEAYEYDYFGPGLFSKGPISSIIKRDVFIRYGGFCSARMVGDFEMWNRLAQKCNVLLMPDGIVWFRRHNEQEMNEYKKYIKAYEKIKIDYLKHQNCPLCEQQVKRIIRERKLSLVRQVFYYFFKGRNRDFYEALTLLKFHLLYK
ncbi:MAG: glycosyltransferase family 2 protein [Bacteroidota bacterium]|nr:glycosyltransferase family 2 protein [Flavisolibacter sp.]MBD0284157.1 glycosyltransferase family 2 protein [Flavisolibacter sp.]MBD0365063.1 glycosyltransferase family 2 protein [Flavisolibacter sp.]MBD0374368.1 glycosyltransferase family 2 protein [Flavisolibacter sp.]MDQ3843450.1 glycosyltransferase family 2 protein [Bacteroidota bacterium]